MQALRHLLLPVLASMMTLTAAAQTPHTHQHGFDDAQKWAKVFDDPERDAWQKPHEVIQALALRPGAVIADIGAGTGYFTMRFAHMVPKGRVYAVDTEPAMVKHLAERAKANGLHNVTAVAGAPDCGTSGTPRPTRRRRGRSPPGRPRDASRRTARPSWTQGNHAGSSVGSPTADWLLTRRMNAADSAKMVGAS